MILLIATPTLVIYIAILGVTMWYTYQESKQVTQRSMTQLASAYASRFDGELTEIARIADTTADFVETVGPMPDEMVYEQLQRNVARTPLVYGACMAFEPGVVKPPGELFAPYVHRDGNAFHRLNIDRSVYDWSADPKYTWFTLPKQLGHGVWSEPYFDEGAGNILMATYSAPFRLHGTFGGVSTVDIDLPRLRAALGEEFEKDLDFFIIAQDGRFVFDPDSSRIMAKTIFDVASEAQHPSLERLGRQMLRGEAGVAVLDGWETTPKQWVFFAPIRSTKWVFAIRYPEGRVLADVRRRTTASAIGLGVTLVLIVTCIVVVSRRIAAPIIAMKDSVQHIGRGNLDVRIEESGGADELRHLARSFNQMTSELQLQIDRLAQEQAARARIERDLVIAREIQQSLLPAADPISDRLEVAGRSRYCDETGGDYYDFIDLSYSTEGAALVAIGDVTGHGIAAALLMATARAALRVQATEEGQLCQMLTRVNRLLASDNRHARFMTMTLMVIDPVRGHVRWASAGHDPAIVFRPSDDSFRELDGGNLPLGIVPDTVYDEFRSESLLTGDIVILGTDGIWETRDRSGQMYGKDRLRDLMRQYRYESVSELARAIEDSLDMYRAGGTQMDDITFVVIRLK